jgi:hypothetical protein
VRLSWKRRNVLYALTNRLAINQHVKVDDSRAKITCSVGGYDKDGNSSYIRSVLEIPNAMERPTHSHGRAPNAAQHKRQILTGSVEIEASQNKDCAAAAD